MVISECTQLEKITVKKERKEEIDRSKEDKNDELHVRNGLKDG